MSQCISLHHLPAPLPDPAMPTSEADSIVPDPALLAHMPGESCFYTWHGEKAHYKMLGSGPALMLVHAPDVGASCLERPKGGRGVLMGGASGVAPARVVVLGAGMAGSNAAQIAAGMEAEVTIVDRNVERLRQIDQVWHGRIQTAMSSSLGIERLALDADLVVGAVLVPGAKAPHLVSAEVVSRMKQGAVLVDISIDQGGCFETSRPTTHSHPTFEVDGITHYCVTNMPGAVPITSTYALTNATMPYVLHLAAVGVRGAIAANPGLRLGVNVAGGHVTYPPVAEAVGVPYVPVEEAYVDSPARTAS